MIFKCSCDNAFQDARYGKNMRVHTEGQKGDVRCTVCSAVKSGVTAARPKEKKPADAKAEASKVETKR